MFAIFAILNEIRSENLFANRLYLAHSIPDLIPFQMIAIHDFLKKPLQEPFYGVIGHPVAQSKSPLIHNLALKHHAMRGSYVALDTPGSTYAFVGKLLSLKTFRGLNVTIPHKSRIMEALDVVDTLALEVGAVNTVHPARNGLAGYNTDVAGFVETLRPHALWLTGSPAVVLGSGGAARAAVASLLELKVPQAFVVSRKPREISAAWPSRLNGVEVCLIGYEQLGAALREASAVINTTPLGMFPNPGRSPVPFNLADELKGRVCMDAIYNPLETHFMKQARNAGAHAVLGGLTMFVEQAAAAFRIWTGRGFPKQEAAEAIRKSLSAQAPG